MIDHVALCYALDGLLAADYNATSDVPEKFRKDEPEDWPDQIPVYKRLHTEQRRAEFKKTFDPEHIIVEQVSWADLKIEVDPLRPYHVWGVFLHPDRLRERVRQVPPGVKCVLIGPGEVPEGVYHLPEMPKRRIIRRD